MTIHQNRFDIDDKGFKLQMKDKNPYRLCNDMIQNCLDEDSVSKFSFDIKKVKGTTNVWNVKIKDNGDGFRRTSDTYTLFAESYKRNDPTKIGQFNIGEKEFFGACIQGEITTKNLKVVFPTKGGRIETKLEKPVKGTHVSAYFKWTDIEVEEILTSIRNIIVKKGKTFLINEVQTESKTPLRTFDAKLWTEIQNEQKKMTRNLRETKVEIYEKENAEKGWLFEIGIPVCELLGNIDWNVNVLQKVIQTKDRTTISEAYLKDLYGVILNNTVDLLDKDESSSTFVQIGMKSATEETAKTILKNVYKTENVYIKSATDHHANERALDTGGELVLDGMFDRDTRKHLKDIGVLTLASDKFGSGTEVPTPAKITKDMLWFSGIVKRIALDALKKNIENHFVKTENISASAWFDGKSITWNTSRLPKDFFSSFGLEQTKLTIHELGHEDGGIIDGISHYSHEYIDALIKVGAIIAQKGIKHYLENKN